MTDFLEQVGAERRACVAAARAARPLAHVLAAARAAPPPRGFVAALRRRRLDDRLAVIAEVKRRSPALGPLAPIPDPADLARLYEGAGAAAVSVLVEPEHWSGSLEDLSVVAKATRIPVLAKDVVVDEYQIAEAAADGASAVLLIAELLGEDDLRGLVRFARDLRLDALVEAHEPQAFARAVRSGASAVGVNARDLRHPERIERGRVRALAAIVADDQVLVAESGIASAGDARALPKRVDAILVGTALVTAPDPRGLLRSLAGVRPGGVLV